MKRIARTVGATILLVLVVMGLTSMPGCQSSGEVTAQDAATALVILDVAAATNEPTAENVGRLATSLDLLLENSDLTDEQRIVARAAIAAALTALNEDEDFDVNVLITAARGVLAELAAQEPADAPDDP